MTFRRDDQNAEKPTFYDGIQLIQSHLYATTGLTMKVRIELFGFLKDSTNFQDFPSEFFFEGLISLDYLLNEILKLKDMDKVVLVNQKYVPPNYSLREGDVVQIFPPLDGG